jgi:hypothetical protein
MRYIVHRYFSGFCSDEVDADNEYEAHEIAKEMPLDYDEILSTLEEWEEADQVEMIDNID